MSTPLVLHPGSDLRPPRTVRVIAHRGASARAPENTLAALAAAVADGADLVEVDVQRTADGVLVLLHDPRLERTTDARSRFGEGRELLLGSTAYDDIARLDAGSWFSPAFAGERVPRLTDALHLLVAARTGLQLELKRPELYPGVVDQLVAELERVRGRIPLLVQSFHEPSLRELRRQAPWLELGLLGRPHARRLAELGTWLQQVNPHHRRLDRRYVDAVHAAGMRCTPWTVDRRSAMRRVCGLGVDGVITDHPARLHEALA
ncbi:glycerophosphodiester phosphodiesterase [Nocardioidaceae bacterium]|nr:glycerophosphodiester phosphodiesterase [Nocardioidaceae bacterium]